MWTTWLSVLLLLVMLSSCPSLASMPECDDSTGRHFHIGVLPSYLSGMNYSIVVSTKATGNVTILVPSIGLNRSLDIINNSRTIPINGLHTIHTQNNTVENKGIILTSTVDITVALITEDEEVLILPTECLSTRYIVASYYSNRQYHFHGDFLVIGTQDNTTIHVTARIGNAFVNNFVVNLNSMQSYYYNNVEDLTGTTISSDKPIAVFSGHEEVVFAGYQGYLSEQLLPASLFGSTFIVPTLYPMNRYFIRIISSESNTQLVYRESGVTVNKVVELNSTGTFVEIMSTEPLLIDAKKPVSVMLYCFGYNDSAPHAGAPLLSTVQAMSQYKSEYMFTLPSDYKSFTNYISIVSTSTSLAGVKLDGNDLPYPESSFNLTLNGTVYNVNTYNVSDGYHRLLHLNGIPFGASVYGYKRYYSYGTPLGLQFQTQRQIGLTTSKPATTPFTATPSTATPFTTTLSDRQMCYSCSDLSQLYICNTVKACGPRQTCYVERFEIPGGDIRYNSGCIETEKCSNTTSDGCLECCHGNYCNAKGCNAEALPPRESRGPMCFDCHHVTNMAECHTVRLCYPDQVCGIEKESWGGLIEHVSAGCHSKLCTANRKRSVPDCLQCCPDDFCNVNCNQTNVDPVFVG